MRPLVTAVIALFLITSCTGTKETDSWWDSPSAWYDSGKAIDDTLTDVFYVISVEVAESHDSTGNEVPRATLTDDERKAYLAEMDFARKGFGDEFNFFSPFYHQFTLNALKAERSVFDSVKKDVSTEICEAFDYYMSHFNNGRKFIIAGFSQGAMAVLELLKHMSDEQYSRMAAAYMIGFRLTDEELTHPHIKAAESGYDTGVTVSFNSVTDTGAIWSLVASDAATCINPVNWRTDTTSAPLFYGSDTAYVHVDPEYNVLVVEGLDEEKYWFEPMREFTVKGNLHHYDLLFYMDSIRCNAVIRSRNLE